jgi:tRNA A37 threonylcarbamoyladenosine biosynthesis protein TsaE
VSVATADDMRVLGRALGNALRTASGGALVIGLEGELGAG